MTDQQLEAVLDGIPAWRMCLPEHKRAFLIAARGSNLTYENLVQALQWFSLGWALSIVRHLPDQNPVRDLLVALQS